MMAASVPDPNLIRIGIAGCGEIVRLRHLPALQKIPSCRVTALADTDAHALTSTGRLFHVEDLHSRYQGLVDSPHVDLVAICLPPSLHARAAVEALTAGKHVFIEKPLALSLDDCDTLSAAFMESGSQVLVGHNLRWHRLVRAARDYLITGGLGEITAAVTTFTTRQRRAFLKGWRSAPDQGGDLLNDIGSHHFDLLRYLLPGEFKRVFSQYTQGPNHSEAALVSAFLSDGVQVACTLASGTADQNSLVFHGTRGRLHLDCHRYDGLAHYSMDEHPGSLGFRLRSGLRALISTPQGFLQLRQGGYYARSYQAMWQHFMDCIRKGVKPESDLEDAIEATRIALAALESARLGEAISVPRAPRRAPELAQLKTYEPPEVTGGPALSAIVVCPDRYPTVRQTVRYLQAQSVKQLLEIVLVAPNRLGLELVESDMEGFHSWQVVETGRVGSIAPAYAAGVRLARAPLVALTEDHSFPDEGWAQALIASHELPWAAVGPLMQNGNPDSMVSWADFFIAYGEWSHQSQPQPVLHLPGHNSCYKRAHLLSFKDRLENLLEAESVLHWELRRQGHELLLDPAAKTRHLNFGVWPAWIPIQYHSGRTFAATRAQDWPWYRRLLFTLASPLIPFVRLRRVLSHIQRAQSLAFSLRILPTLLVGLALDGAGQLMGSAFGPGNSVEKAASFEFHRTKYLRKPVRDA